MERFNVVVSDSQGVIERFQSEAEAREAYPEGFDIWTETDAENDAAEAAFAPLSE